MRTIDIIIPVYNEERILENVINQIIETDFCNLEKNIIFVDDCSTDRSREILTKYSQYKCLFHSTNQGKGAAVYTGIQSSTADIVVIQDADMEYNPRDYQKLLPLIINGEAQVVYGSRLKNVEQNKSFLLCSLLANKFLTFLTNILFGCKITDMETCYKAFTKEALQGVKIKAKRFDFEPEITAKIVKKGIKIVEVPISYNGRSWGEGKKITIFDGLQAVFALFYYRFFD